jgi:uncharacterized protein with predicted RNA binding PUA domain
MDPLPINAYQKVCQHVDAIFGIGVSCALPSDLKFEFSRRTGRIKNFYIDGMLAATLRTDGGLALTINGAQYFLDNAESNKQFQENCAIPLKEAVPFVSEGRSLFCKHVKWCGSNIKVRSDVAIVDDDNNRVIAVGIAMLSHILMRRYDQGVAIKCREGLKGRMD